MLDPPISQADIDERTVFVRRDGVEVVITEPRDRDYKPEWKWFDKFGVAYTDDGFYFPSKSQTAADLIARKPKESEMSQVVVEDKRRSKSHARRFICFELGELLSPETHPNSVWFKCGEEKALLLVGAERFGTIQNASTECLCIPRPDLRLRLVLETI